MSDEREVMAWDELGEGARDLAERIHGDGFEPDVILAIARGGLLVAGALGYALGVKNTYTMNVEFYTGVDERLPAPMILPPVPELVRPRRGQAPDRGRRGGHRPDACAGAGLLRGEGGRGSYRRPLREAELGCRVRLRVAQDVSLDHLPVERSAAGHGRARPVGPPDQRLEQG